MPVNLSQYRGTVGLFNSKFIPIKQSSIFYCAFFRNLDTLAMISVLLSFFIYVYVMPSVINGLLAPYYQEVNLKVLILLSVKVHMSTR